MVTNFKPFAQTLNISRWDGKLYGQPFSIVNNYMTHISICHIRQNNSMKLCLDEYTEFDGCMADFIKFKFDEGKSFITNLEEASKEFAGELQNDPEIQQIGLSSFLVVSLYNTIVQIRTSSAPVASRLHLFFNRDVLYTNNYGACYMTINFSIRIKRCRDIANIV